MLESEGNRQGPVPPSSFGHAARRMVAAERNYSTDAQLGMVLTFVAGAVNAGGFFYVGQYTSHMSGIVSAIADHLVLGLFDLVVAGMAAFLFFVAGAAASAILINWGRRHSVGEQYVLPITLECVLLLIFGALAGLALPTNLIQPLGIPLLCFIMGLQNATVTKVSGARMRTTHVTGMVTDIGIELGKFAYEAVSRRGHQPAVLADRPKLTLLGTLLGCFIVGGVVGALGFSWIGPVFATVLSLLLAALVVPSLSDIWQRRSTHPQNDP